MKWTLYQLSGVEITQLETIKGVKVFFQFLTAVSFFQFENSTTVWIFDEQERLLAYCKAR